MNALQRLLLGSGQLPADLRASLAAGDDLLFLEEGLVGSLTTSFRERRSREWEQRWVSGAIAVTGGRRVVVWAGRAKRIDCPIAHPMWARIDFAVDRPDRVRFTSHYAVDPPEWGRIDVRLKTTQARRLAELLADHG